MENKSITLSVTTGPGVLDRIEHAEIVAASNRLGRLIALHLGSTPDRLEAKAKDGTTETLDVCTVLRLDGTVAFHLSIRR